MQRIFETSHVHVFSHATMPIFNLFRNCSYYWMFAAFVSYNINHLLYTEPNHTVMIAAFALAYLCQVRPHTRFSAWGVISYGVCNEPLTTVYSAVFYALNSYTD